MFEVKSFFWRTEHNFYHSVNNSVEFGNQRKFRDSFFCPSWNTSIEKLHLVLKLFKNRLNEVWHHAALCPYLFDNSKHGHWNFTGKYLKSANFSCCSIKVDSVLGYCLCLYCITLTECTLVCEEWGNIETQVNFFQFIAYVKTLIRHNSISS